MDPQVMSPNGGEDGPSASSGLELVPVQMVQEVSHFQMNDQLTPRDAELADAALQNWMIDSEMNLLPTQSFQVVTAQFQTAVAGWRDKPNDVGLYGDNKLRI